MATLLLTGGGLPVDHAFSPADLSPTLWLDASTIAGKNDGDAISAWNDSGSGGHNFSQATGSKQPLYKTGVINAHPVVRFDGVDDMLTGPNISTLVTTSTFEFFSVVRPITITASSSGFSRPCLLAHTDGDVNINFSTTNRAVFWMYDGAYHQAQATGLTVGASIVLSVRHDTGNGYISKSDGSDASTAVGNIVGTLDAARIGASATPEYLNADVAEILVYNTLLSAANRLAVRKYLGAKYGIAVT